MKLILSLFITCIAYAAHAENTMTVNLTNPENTPIGTVTFQDSRYGLLITPHLSQLPPGVHGFHLHEHADCSDQGMKAGSHYDPKHTNAHLGPYAKGHLGDLPALAVNEKGEATLPTLAPRLKVRNLSKLALIIHAGGDTYTNEPPLGGGGARLACGTFPSA